MLPSDAKRVLDLKGQSYTLQKEADGSYAAGGAYTPGAVSEYTIQAHIAEYRADRLSGSLIQVGDRKAVIAADGLSITPEVGDRVVGEGVIQSVQTVREAGVPVIHIAQVRA